MSFLNELKRRKVIRATTFYLVFAWAGIQVMDLLFDAFEMPNWAIQLVIVVLALGLPVAVVFSWTFELTSSGLHRESEPGPRYSSLKLLSLALVSGFSIATALWTADRFITNSTPATAEAPPNSVAVLPFANMSDNPEDVYFSDGLSEELLNLLANIGELRVPARTSSFYFRNDTADVPTIGKVLRVAHVLEGSVRKSGDRLRITAQLIEVENGYHVWSAAYERTLDDVFLVQDEIARAVVNALRVTLLEGVPAARETDPEAFTLYLQALHFYSQRTAESYDKALDYTERVLQIDPRYVPAWTLHSSVLSNLALVGRRDFSTASAEALRSAETALSIDPGDAFANSSRAWVAMIYERNFPLAGRYFRRALDIAPNSPVVLGTSAVFARTIGQLDRAIELSEASIAVDPVSAVARVNLADQLFRAGRHDEAIVAARKTIELSPGTRTGHANLAIAHLLNAQPQLALEAIAELDWPLIAGYIRSLAYTSLGEREQALAELRELEAQFTDTDAFYIAGCHAWLGNTDAAFDWLERTLAEDQPLPGISTDPVLASLHGDTRWQQIMERLGLAPHQVRDIDF